MNKLERLILKQGKKILIKHALAELDEIKKRIEQGSENILFDIFNSGITLDIKAAKRHGIEAIEKRLKLIGNGRKKATEKT